LLKKRLHLRKKIKMYFEDSPFSKSETYEKAVLNFGSYYLFENFFIMEVNEGEHFNSSKLN